ncbi:putative glycosyltransferase [Rubellimicrobium mesophilum DSM 19309]|uniref:Putative glycosyltransferase n=1 Tax=Rubellimicrobium mesophilum DSM 19309 TaxID=442562 RepID=A0A017HKI8_9RHOB|nr:glycosyltransferase family 39 protein [Rubellimicrobium mesophilum]EYD74668.1 putative glycosyltransferase [Rubellimicrobium mesophilum DSM 19309]
MTFLSSRWAILAAALAFVAFTIVMLRLRPPLPIDETRYLTVAWEMWRDRSWLVPHMNGDLYGHKPPLLFWLVDLVWAFAGVTELGARLVAPAFGLASLGLTWLLARRLWPGQRRRAGLAAMILVTTGAFLVYGSSTMFDTMLGTATLWGLLALMTLRRGGGRRSVLSLGAAIALGVYAKGPVILVHLAPAALLMPLWAEPATRPGYGRWLRDLGLALLFALALVALWLAPAVVLGGPDYREEVLWRQSAGRMVAAFAHERPFWFFLALLPLYAWPWGWTPAGLSALAPRRLWADEPGRLLTVWAATAFLAFSLISGKQPHYLVPELPALALLLSGMSLPHEGGWATRLLPLVPSLLALLLVLATAAGRVPDVTVNGSGVTLAGLVSCVILVAVLLAGALWRRDARATLSLAAPLTLLGFLLAASPLLFAGYDPAPIGRILAANEAKGLATADSVYHGQFNFAGRLDGPVAHLTEPGALQAWATEHPGGMVVTRYDVSGVPMEPVLRRVFNSKDYVLYRVPEASP